MRPIHRRFRRPWFSIRAFLRTIGGTESAAYQTVIQYVKAEGVHLYLTPGVVEEVSEQQGYISIDWVDRADTTEWITLLDAVQPGVRVHDGPRAGEVMDRIHERLAEFEQMDPEDRLGTPCSCRNAPWVNHA